MSTEVASFSPRRVGAMILRYWYLLRSSWPRLIELIYWPAVQMFMWGFLQLGVARQAGARLVIVNAQPTAFDDVADAVFNDSISEILPKLI